jgi:hypothetical protein
MIAHVRKLLAGGVLAAGLLGLVPAKAANFVEERTNQRNTVGDTVTLISDFSMTYNVHCSLNGWSAGNSTTQHSACRLDRGADSRWRLVAAVYQAGASVSCKATCYG